MSEIASVEHAAPPHPSWTGTESQKNETSKPMKTMCHGVEIDLSRDDLLTDFAFDLLRSYYMLDDEDSPQEAFARAAVAYCFGDLDFAQRIYDYVSKGWFMFASPVLSNAPRPGEAWKALPISCFVAGTPVMTEASYKNIEDIHPGDMVWTHKGRLRRVVATRESDSSDLYRVVVNGRRTPLTVTGNHLLLTNLGWVRVDALDVMKHLVACDHAIQSPEEPHTIDILNTSTPYTQFKRNQVDTSVGVSEDLAWALGFWFAEGSTHDNGTVSVTHGDMDPCVRWSDIMSDHFGVKGVAEASQTWHTGRVCSKTLQEWFDAEFGKGCTSKVLAPWMLRLPKGHLKAFYDGFYLGDGWKTSKHRAVEVSNPQLIAGIHQILMKLGIDHTLQLRKRTRSLSTVPYNGIIVERNTSDERRHHSLKKGIVFHDGLEYNQIQSIEKLDIHAKVYDIQVEEDESFLAAGVVAHNCFLTYVPDTLEGLIEHTSELRWLSVKGGGVGGHWSSVRAVSKKSPGPIPFLKTVDADMTAYRQGTCYTPDTEVMTEHGWVRFDMLDPGVKVAQVTSDLNVVFDTPLELVVEDHAGDILNVRAPNGSVNLMVTPNHSMVVEQRVRVGGKKAWSGVLEKRRADELPRHADVRFHTSARSSNTGPAMLTPEDRFRIAFQADGHNHARGGGCSFHLKKARKIDRAREILDACGYSYREVDAPDGSVKFYVHAPVTGDKTFAWVDLTGISPEWGAAFLDELRHWDATSRGEGYAGFTYLTTDKGNADVVQAIAALSGRTSRMSVREASGNRKDLWKVYVRPNQHLTLQKVDVTPSPYEGKVYCATVSTGMLLVRRSGVVTVCGNTRKGSYAAYLDVSHPDILEFLQIRLPTGGDPNRKCLNLHNAVNITDDFMEACINGGDWNLLDPNDGSVRETINARDLFQRILEVRFRTGEPYLNFIDTANRAMPQPLKDKGLKIHGSNLCSEIHLPTAEDRTAVCCLSSLNLAKFDEWVDTPLVRDLIRMLDNVLQVFIDNAPDELARARYSATRERSLGLGAMGFHSYLQDKGLPWESALTKMENMRIFQHIQSEAVAATEQLAEERGEYPDGAGSGRRNAHLLAIAPNANSSIILGISPSIETWKSNAFTHRTRAGSHQVRNPALVKILDDRIEDDAERERIWSSITTNQGSVQHLPEEILSDWEKQVFKTAFEIDQRWVVGHAADRQPFICQGQSVNLFFPAGSNKNYVLMTHVKAWKEGLKALYYLRTSAGVSAEVVNTKIERVALKDYVENEECLSCQG